MNELVYTLNKITEGILITNLIIEAIKMLVLFLIIKYAVKAGIIAANNSLKYNPEEEKQKILKDIEEEQNGWS